MQKYVVASVDNYFRRKIKNKSFIFINKKELLTLKKIKKINPKIIFFPHWHWKVSEEILNNYKCIGFHETPLPYGRGGSPIQNMIIRGHKETQICAIKMTKRIDKGPVYKRVKVSLQGSGNQIFERIYEKIFHLIKIFLIKLPKPKAQFGRSVIFKRRKPEESNIHNFNEIKKLYDHIRMLDIDKRNFPKAFIKTKNFILQFSHARLKNKEIICKVKIEKFND